ncbi:unnamed protein product, partial [Porites lobata]
CHALNPANKTWGSVFQSLVTSTNIQDQITFKQSPFKTSCFAVEFGIKREVSIKAEFQVIDWKFPAAFLAGLVIFYNAERLSRNSLFFYSSGVSLGLIMSLLLLVYILHRLIPGVRKNGVGSMLRLIPRVFSFQEQLVLLFIWPWLFKPWIALSTG